MTRVPAKLAGTLVILGASVVSGLPSDPRDRRERQPCYEGVDPGEGRRCSGVVDASIWQPEVVAIPVFVTVAGALTIVVIAWGGVTQDGDPGRTD